MWWNMYRYFHFKLGINSAVWIKSIDETLLYNILLLMPNCYEVIVVVATNGRYGCVIVMSLIEISKAVFWPSTSAFLSLDR